MTALPRLFISYAREDQEVVKLLSEGLERAGYVVWWDKRLELGEVFRDSIEEQLKLCDAVLVVWSKRARSSRWVLDEAERGAERGILLPLRIDSTRLPLGFGAFNALDLRAWGGNYASDSWRKLLSGINRVVAVQTQRPSRPAIRLLPQALVLIAAWGTVIGALWWSFYSRAVGNSILGFPILDAICLGWLCSAAIVLWCTVEVRRAGFESLACVFRRSVWWFLIGSMLALVIIAVAIAGGALHASTPRKALVELARVFLTATTIATVAITSFNLVRWAVKRVFRRNH